MRDQRQLAPIARRQQGLITRKQAVESGLTDHHLRLGVNNGSLGRLARGRYADALAPASWVQEVWAALAGFAGHAAASHRTAAALFKLTGYPPGPIEVLVPVGLGTRNPLATVHRTRNLSSHHTAIGPHGLRITTAARTLVDLASVESDPARFLSAFDDAVCRGLTSTGQVAATAARVVRGGRPGRELIDAGLAQWTAGRGSDNFGEMEVVRLLVAAGLPAPLVQHEVRDGTGAFIARVDAAYPWARLAIERDSQRWHGSRRAVDRDIQRELRLQAAGWHVRRVSRGEMRAGAATFLAAVRMVLEPAIESGLHLSS